MAATVKFRKILRFITNPGLYRNFFPSLIKLKNFKREPIIIVGAPRSGTTLLMSLIDSHPEITTIPEETMILLERKGRFFANRFGQKLFVRTQLTAVFLSIPIKSSANRWCEKTPSNIFHIEYINNLFDGKVKFVHIVRDGRDVVLSKHNRLGRFMNAEKWMSFVNAGLEKDKMPNLYRLGYEQLVLNFEETTESLRNFLGLQTGFSRDFHTITSMGNKRSRHLFNTADHKKKGNLLGELNESRVAKWKKSGDDKLVKEFYQNEIAMALLKKLNYTE